MNRALALALFTIILTAIASGLPPGAAFADENQSGLQFSGDVRGRYEGFWYNEDPDGSKRDPRSRLRYRLRLNAKARINDHGAFAMRIGTGGTDSRSGNQTLGDPVDFGPNDIAIRRAYLIINPWADGKLPGRMVTGLSSSAGFRIPCSGRRARTSCCGTATSTSLAPARPSTRIWGLQRTSGPTSSTRSSTR